MHALPRRVVAVAAFLLTLGQVAPAGADEVCQEDPTPVASVLVIHGGAWMGGSARDGRDVCAPLAAMGFRVRSLEYPLWTVPGSIHYAQQAAKEESARGWPVYATGISAGASIAEFLAIKSDIDGAVVIAPLSDFVDWRPITPGFWGKLGMTPAMRARFSPYHNIERPAPLRIVHSPQDHTVPYEQSVRMVTRCGRSCELVPLKLGLGHMSLGARGQVLHWFAREALNPRRVARPGGAPVISRAALRPRSFAVDSRRRGSAARRRAGEGGSILSYTLSAPARMVLTIERRRGRTTRHDCTRKARGRKHAGGCARPLGRRTIEAGAGGHRTRFHGWIGRRALRPGHYRLTLVATAAWGVRSLPHRLDFTVRR